jgi:hypothetical protein
LPKGYRRDMSMDQFEVRHRIVKPGSVWRPYVPLLVATRWPLTLA